jgi:hypothetical protein
MGNVATDVADNMADVACCPYVFPVEATGNIEGGNPGNKPFPDVATPSRVAGGGNMESCPMLPTDVATRCGGCGAVVNPSWPECFACGEPREPAAPRVACDSQAPPAGPTATFVSHAPDISPPCGKGTPCDLAGQEARYCRDHCRPAWEREAGRVKPQDVDPAPGLRRGPPAAPRPAWRVEVDTEWPEDYRRAYPVLAESSRRAGHPQGIAEYGAYLDLEETARRFAQEGTP